MTRIGRLCLRSGVNQIDAQQAHEGLALVHIALAQPALRLRPWIAAINAPIVAAVARGELSRYALLDRIEVLEALPKASVGKNDKKSLRMRFGGRPDVGGSG